MYLTYYDAVAQRLADRVHVEHHPARARLNVVGVGERQPGLLQALRDLGDAEGACPATSLATRPTVIEEETP